MPEIDKNTCDCAVSLFRVKTDAIMNPTSRMSFGKAVDLFDRFIDNTKIALSDIDESLVSEWVSWLFGHGYSYKTVTYYVNRLSSLYNKVVKDSSVNDSGGFLAVKEKLRRISPLSLEMYSIRDCFAKLRRLVLADFSKNPTRQLAKDVVLFSLYNGGLTFERIAKYRKDEYSGHDVASSAIVEKYSKPKNKYLFPLNQSVRTTNQLNRAVSALFAEALRSVDIRLSVYNSDTAVDLWAIVAISCGFSATDVAGCIIDSEIVNPIYSFAVRRSDITEEQKVAIMNRVARILAKDPEDWYAMQFRPYVKYDQVKERLTTAGIHFSKTFYPMEEIILRVGKRMKRVSKPVVPGLFFFKSKAIALPALYNCIGDLAWGYRYSRNARSQYAVIPPYAIAEYEIAVGQFIDSIESYPDGDFRYEEGDKVVITSGEFIGHPATFEKEIRDVTLENGQVVTRIINRLRLAGVENYSWIVDLDPRRMMKISDEKFDSIKKSFQSERV